MALLTGRLVFQNNRGVGGGKKKKCRATNKNNNAVTHKQGITRFGALVRERGLCHDDKSDKS